MSLSRAEMARKKDDDYVASPAQWVARHGQYARGLRSSTQFNNDPFMRRRSDHQIDQNRGTEAKGGPLVDQVTNAWRQEKASSQFGHDEEDPVAKCFDLEDTDSCPNVTARLVTSRRFKRLLAFLLAALIAGIFVFIQIVEPKMKIESLYKMGFTRVPRGTYGFGRAGEYNPPDRRLVELNADLIPGGSMDSQNARRLIFIGDIHGCYNELKALLRAINHQESTDHVITTGDVVSKGPDSQGVLDELIRLKATSVRGNHEDRLLSIYDVKTDEEKQMPQLTRGAAKDKQLIQSLRPRQIDYMRNMPLILRIPPLPQALLADPDHRTEQIISSEILVVHAGLVPAVPLAQQDPYFVMNMRSIQRRTHVPFVTKAATKHDTLPWSELWNWYHDRLLKNRGIRGWHIWERGLEEDHDRSTWSDMLQSIFQKPSKRYQHRSKAQVVVYGHDSQAGLVDQRWSKGLDSACVRGGRLTALVVDAFGKATLHSVDCEYHE